MDRNLIKHTGGYKQVSCTDLENHIDSVEPSPTTANSSLSSPKPERVSMQFAKAALIFKDKLEDVRGKSRTGKHEHEAPPTPSTSSPPQSAQLLPPSTSENQPEGDNQEDQEEDPITARRLRTIRLVQNTLTSLVSIAIAVLQAKALVSYQQTKNTPGAWPTYPNLMPTIMLMVVAILTGLLDLCLSLAYLFPSHAAVFLKIATKAQNVATCAKGLSYLLTAVVCRSGFDYGKSSGQNNDLWGWTCSSAAEKFDDLTQARANCVGQVCGWCNVSATLKVSTADWNFFFLQAAAWYIALVQIGIEGIGVFGTVFINQQSRKARGKDGSDAFSTADYEKMSTWGQALDKTLSGMTLQADDSGGSS